ncbi:MAG TPA: PhoH family protein [Candidatus Ozemobacteraceae bacterium]
MSRQEEVFELTEDVCRHMLGAGESRGLELIRSIADVTVRARGNQLLVGGEPARIGLVRKFIEALGRRIATEGGLGAADMRRLFTECVGDVPGSAQPARTAQEAARQAGESYPELLVTHSGRPVRAKTAMQQSYLDAIRSHEVTISIGPAGTGKTYLACAMAVRALRDRQVSRVILSRPTIEAGEKLGYLPGDLMEKVDPHFRPLYDALQEFLGIARFQQLLRQGVIEITPLGYMRGRTFNEAFIVLDEAQNTTEKQMRMFLTRMGYGSRVVVTGDRTQIDLPSAKDSSLHTLRQVLGGIDRLAFIDLGEQDVIRHELVRRIIQAYEIYDTGKGGPA